MTRASLLLAFLACLAFGPAAHAQEQAALVADSITVTGGNQLRAEGNVEVLYQGMRLRARAITYNAARDRIFIEGPMSFAQGPDIIILADAGELDADFRNGLLTSARLVLDQQLQVAGAELQRVDGRYTQLYRAVASSCPVCSSSDVPLWQIRASRAIHDQELRRMYYYDAVFEVAGLPIFYVPRLRMPDASVERASGFLVPRIVTSNVLGSGLKVPYFLAINDHSDVTFTGFVSPQTTTLGFAFRQLFKTGAVSMTGAVSDDELIPEYLRGFLFTSGVFFLPRDFELRFDIEMSSDDSYLFDYGISTQDRLHSEVSLSRVRRSTYSSANLSNYVSFRDDEAASVIPAIVGRLDQVHEFRPRLIGGTAQYRLQAYGLQRTSSVDVAGRDYARISAGLGWHRAEVLGPGLLLEGEADFSADHYAIAQDSTVGNQTDFTAVGAVALSWPMKRIEAGGATQILEPKIQLVTSTATATDIPNEESTLVEFDEGALWSLDRLPGASQYEIGNRVGAGLTWRRLDPDGWEAAVTVGRIFRDSDPDQFNNATGLSGYRSDWLVATQFDLDSRLTVATRLLLADDLGINRNDTKVHWQWNQVEVDANFLWHVAEPEVGRDQKTWELNLDTGFPISRTWRAEADLRYDFIADRAAAAGLNLIYEGPCITLNLGGTRTFTSSESVTPITAIEFSVSVPQGTVASTRPNLQCGG